MSLLLLPPSRLLSSTVVVHHVVGAGAHGPPVLLPGRAGLAVARAELVALVNVQLVKGLRARVDVLLLLLLSRVVME